MADYHILDMDELENRVGVIFHIPVPDELNKAGVNLRTAVKQYLENQIINGTITSKVPWISSSELIDIQNGLIYEHFKLFQFSNAHATKTTKMSELNSEYTRLVTRIQDKIRKTLKYWGLDVNVA